MDLANTVAEKIIRRYDPSLRLQRVGPLDGGATERAFELTLDEDRRLVLKLFDPGQAWQLQQEVLVYELLSRTRGRCRRFSLRTRAGSWSTATMCSLARSVARSWHLSIPCRPKTLTQSTG